MNADELDYDLPPSQIAQRPPTARDGGRLLVLDRGTTTVSHQSVRDLPGLLRPSLLVVNDSRVFPARLRGVRVPSGGRVELLLLERDGESGTRERWRALGRSSKGLKPGSRLALDGGRLVALVRSRSDGGTLEVELEALGGETVADAVAAVGRVPLPPYIQREDDADDRERYQTVYAAEDGSVAAPTAGLHFSASLLESLADAGHRTAKVTLHVGPGTFRPVREGDLDAHAMHEERYRVPAETRQAIAEARAEGRPVVAIGTTVVRTLEAAADDEGLPAAGWGRTDLFIRPGFAFRVIDGMFTNFHLPRSTLLALVMAFGGVEAVRGAYREAVDAGYRFTSYGDAMLLAPAEVRR